MAKIKTEMDGEKETNKEGHIDFSSFRDYYERMLNPMAYKLRQNKVSFIENDVPIVYTGIRGKVFIYSDLSSFVPLWGMTSDVEKAIRAGKVKGLILEKMRSDEFIVPKLSMNSNGPKVSYVFGTISDVAYGALNGNLGIEAEVRNYSKSKNVENCIGEVN